MTTPRVLVVGLGQCAEGFRALLDGMEGSAFRDKDTEWLGLPVRERARIAADHDVVHYFWGKVKPREMWAVRRRVRLVVTHFVGSDVTHVLRRKRKIWTQRAYGRLGVETAVVHENLARELGTAGIRARVVPFVSRSFEVAANPLPEEPAALCYVPEGRERFFHLDWILAAARELPHVRFTVFPHPGRSQMPNVHYVPRIPFEHMDEAIDAHTVLVRLPEHDGLPQTRFEAMARSRHVLWTFAGEATRTVESAEDLLRELGDLTRAPSLNDEGAEYVRRELGVEQVRARYLDLWTER